MLRTVCRRSFAAAAMTLLACGCGSGEIDNDFGELSEPEPVEEVAVEEPEPEEEEAKPAKGGNVFARNDRGLVNMREAMEANPKLFKTVNGSGSNNYLVALKDSGFAATSKVQTSYLTYDLRAFQAEHGRLPTFEEFKARWEATPQNLAGLKPYQMYAYDDETGEIALLEDPDERERIHGK